MADHEKEYGKDEGKAGDSSAQNSPKFLLQRSGRSSSVYSKFKDRKSSYWTKDRCDENHHVKLLLGPLPDQGLGPKACILPHRNFPEQDIRNEIFVQDPTSQFLHWKHPPQNVLIIKKINDSETTEDSKILARWLIKEKKMNVYVEPDVVNEKEVSEDLQFEDIRKELMIYSKGKDLQKIDLIACLGGDGTLLHASSLFQECCPPIVAFHLGTLGFLMPFAFSKFKNVIDQTLNEYVGLTLRTRLKAKVIEETDEGNITMAEHLVLNEVVIDRGPTPNLVNLQIQCNGQHLTTLLGDGLIVATATGSTAYSAATGASMVHPSVPCIILTPICPHSLSFRPIIVPTGVELKVGKSPTSRKETWVSFDGRNSIELKDSSYVRITTSVYPLGCVSHQDHLRDWFDSLAECLNWNTRDISPKRRQSDDNDI